MSVHRITVTVTVSRFHRPWSEVIWDRPNPVFIDSLFSADYTFPEACAIGERACRDPGTVDRPDATIAVMHRIISENPTGHKVTLTDASDQPP